MASQASYTPWPGPAPGQREPLPELLASFGHGGAQAEAAPSAALAVALEAVAGPDGQYEGADTDALVGIVRQWAAIESWAAAGLLAALRAMTREDSEGSTLQRRAERPGDNRLLGPLDPAITRELAAAAARSPHSRWEVTIVDGHGYAVGHGVARARPPESQPPGQAAYALPARVNITVTETLLRQLATQPAQPRSGAPPDAWELAPKTTTDDYGTWTLTLPGGRDLTVRFDVVPTHACDHRHRVNTYAPTGRLRRLIQIRDHECTFPPCSRPAHESDFEHAVPYDQGGPTDACNAGARSRRCHQVKQSKGWKVTQPKPGWHQWTTPTGRTYIQEPWRYPA